MKRILLLLVVALSSHLAWGAATISDSRVTGLAAKLDATAQAVDADPAGTDLAAAFLLKADTADIGTAGASTVAANGSQVSGELPTVRDYRLAGWPTAENRNVQALTASITLTNDNTTALGRRFQYLTPDANTWDVELPASGDCIYFENLSGTNTFDITVAATPVGTVAANGSGSAIWNGTAWLTTVSYEINQNVRTTDPVVHMTVDTGQGANELYDMDQHVLTTSSPTFAALTAGTATWSLASGTTAVDFSATTLYRTLSISANTTFTGTNYAVGKQQVYFVTSDGTLRTLTFPANWVFMGPEPADIAASKTGVLSLLSTTTADTGVRAAWAVQE